MTLSRIAVKLTGWETRQRLLFCTLEKTLLGTRQEVELLKMTSFPTRRSMSWKTLCLTSSCSNTHSWNKRNCKHTHTHKISLSHWDTCTSFNFLKHSKKILSLAKIFVTWSQWWNQNNYIYSCIVLKNNIDVLYLSISIFCCFKFTPFDDIFWQILYFLLHYICFIT